MNYIYQCHRTNQRDAKGAIVLKAQKRPAAFVGLCDRISNAISTVKTAIASTAQNIEHYLDKAWAWVEKQDAVLNSWIDEAVVQLANAHLQFEV